MQLSEKKLANISFLHNPEVNHPPKHNTVSEPLRSWPLPFQTPSITITLFIVKSVAGMATDLTLNYANFAPLNVWNFAYICFPYMSVLCYANFWSLKCFEQYITIPYLTKKRSMNHFAHFRTKMPYMFLATNRITLRRVVTLCAVWTA